MAHTAHFPVVPFSSPLARKLDRKLNHLVQNPHQFLLLLLSHMMGLFFLTLSYTLVHPHCDWDVPCFKLVLDDNFNILVNNHEVCQ